MVDCLLSEFENSTLNVNPPNHIKAKAAGHPDHAQKCLIINFDKIPPDAALIEHRVIKALIGVPNNRPISQYTLWNNIEDYHNSMLFDKDYVIDHICEKIADHVREHGEIPHLVFSGHGGSHMYTNGDEASNRIGRQTAMIEIEDILDGIRDKFPNGELPIRHMMFWSCRSFKNLGNVDEEYFSSYCQDGGLKITGFTENVSLTYQVDENDQPLPKTNPLDNYYSQGITFLENGASVPFYYSKSKSIENNPDNRPADISNILSDKPSGLK